jgi:hypothetical protein
MLFKCAHRSKLSGLSGDGKGAAAARCLALKNCRRGKGAADTGRKGFWIRTNLKPTTLCRCWSVIPEFRVQVALDLLLDGSSQKL